MLLLLRSKSRVAARDDILVRDPYRLETRGDDGGRRGLDDVSDGIG